MARYILLAAAAALAPSSTPVSASSRAYLMNNDVITGEPRAISSGILCWETPYGAVLNLPLANLKEIRSDADHRLTTNTGAILDGRLHVTDGQLVLQTGGFGDVRLPAAGAFTVSPGPSSSDATNLPLVAQARIRATGAATTEHGESQPPLQTGSDPAAQQEGAVHDALRSSGYLLRRSRSDWSMGMYYRRRAGTDWLAASSRESGVDLSLRHGLDGQTEVSIGVPLAWRRVRAIAFDAAQGPLAERSVSRAGLGDLRIGARRMLLSEGNGKPETIVFTEFIAPLDREPDPANPLAPSLSDGGYRSLVGLNFLKASDPLVFFASVSYLHTWNRWRTSVWDYSDVVAASGGIAFAVNHEAALGAELSWQYQGPLNRRTPAASGKATEPVSLRLWLTYRLGRAWTWEPSLRFGLNGDDTATELATSVVQKF